MAKKDNEEIPFTAGSGSGASEKLKALQAAMDKIEKDLPIDIKCLADFEKVEEPEETGRTFAANARLKAIYYAKKLGKPCIADDSRRC